MSVNYATMLADNNGSNLRLLANNVVIQNWGTAQNTNLPLSTKLASSNHTTVVSIAASKINVTADILPTACNVYDLGSADFRFKDLYLSGNTIDLGGMKLQKSADTGGLQIVSETNQPVDTSTRNMFATGNVGIGTTIANARVHVYHTGAGDILRVDDEIAPDTTPFIINQDGNVGVGTINPTQKLHVAGTVVATGVSLSNLTSELTNINVSGKTLSNVASLNVIGVSLSNLTSELTNINVSGKTLSNVASLSVTGVSLSNLTSELTNINVSGKTLSNVASLNVTGNITTTGTLTASNLSIIGDFVTLNTMTSNTEQMVVTNAGTGPALKVTQTGAFPIAEFYDGDDTSVPSMYIANNGLVGIGTSTPLARAHVYFTGTGDMFRVDDSAAPDTTPFVINQDGNVGVGTTNPQSLLQLNGGALTFAGTSIRNVTYTTFNTFTDGWYRLGTFRHNSSGEDCLITISGGVGYEESVINSVLSRDHLCTGYIHLRTGSTDPSGYEVNLTGTFWKEGQGTYGSGSEKKYFLQEVKINTLDNPSYSTVWDVYIRTGAYIGAFQMKAETSSTTGCSFTFNPAINSATGTFTSVGGTTYDLVSEYALSAAKNIGLIMDSTGEIGIGTTVPTANFHVDSSIDQFHSTPKFQYNPVVRVSSSDLVPYDISANYTSTTLAITGGVQGSTLSPVNAALNVYSTVGSIYLSNGGYITLGNSTPAVPTNILSASFTIETWVYNTTTPTTPPTPGIPYLIGSMSQTSGTNWWSFGINNNNKVAWYSVLATPNTFSSRIEGNTTVPINTWVHIAIKYDSTTRTMQLFLNGVAETLTLTNISGTTNITVSSTTATFPLSSTTSNASQVIIGRYSGVYHDFYVSHLRMLIGTAQNPTTTLPLTNIANTKLLLATSSTQVPSFTVLQNGNVGVGTNTPSNKLAVNSSVSIMTSQMQVSHPAGDNGIIIKRITNDAGHANLLFLKSRGEEATPLVQGDNIGRLMFFGVTQNNPSVVTQHLAEIDVVNTVFSGGNADAAMRFWTKSQTGFVTERMRIVSDGNVGIGLTNPLGKLHIDSTLLTASTSTTTKGENDPMFRVTSTGLTPYDASGNNLTFTYANSALVYGSTFSPTGSTVGSMYFNYSYITMTSPVTTNMITTDWTLETWIYNVIGSGLNQPMVIGDMAHNTGGNSWSFGVDSSHRVAFYIFLGAAGGWGTVATTTTVPLTTWTHIAAKYVASTKVLNLYIGGVAQPLQVVQISGANFASSVTASGTNATFVAGAAQGASSTSLLMGQYNFSSYQFYVSNLRFVYGSQQTPSTILPLTAVTNTRLLILVSSVQQNLTVLQNGSVGIGTTNPQAKLDVYGNIRAGSEPTTSVYLSNKEVKLRGDGSAHFSIFNENSRLTFRDTSEYFQPGIVGNTLMCIYSNILGGSVGIGTTNPSKKLSVLGATAFGTVTTYDLGSIVNVQHAGTNHGIRSLDTNLNTTIIQLLLTTARSSSASFNYILCEANHGSFGGAGPTDNKFKVQGDGIVAADGAYSSAGADYAEFFEWSDGNVNNDDRRGMTVVLTGSKIRLAVHEDDPLDIIGVVSSRPTVIGDSADMGWSEKYLKDDFGSYIMEDFTIVQWYENSNIIQYDVNNISSNITIPDEAEYITQQRQVLNPLFDPQHEYVSREKRREWSPIGLVGKIRIRKGQPISGRWKKMRDISSNVEEWFVR